MEMLFTFLNFPTSTKTSDALLIPDNTITILAITINKYPTLFS